ncbi:hypothetical protein N0V93_007055 [Gnomoniopsis smithogilvyi]|uniref:Heterokaryon incompatibility domain-containing protein n=1 Tax=Gnomoniopsis smithogilvyi TaxID=1191159 RepID=A0A9W9CVA8_9PEZI|nr:hypothetical protein N0V93_007055 [Gnomoniopsis smithogilvyi]
MRLLHTEESHFKVFIGQKPEYAILSHTWGEREANYQTFLGSYAQYSILSSSDPRHSDLPPGIRKIHACRVKARENGFDWVWIDTCCIDKSSSSELSEAINSMFQWYAEASVCYAYLSDIEPVVQADWTLDRDCRLAFEGSRWWTRGWCLQELIAPRNVEFLASDWSPVGTKFSLRQLINKITGIRLQVLMGINLKSCCAGEKMSWSSTRETTRPEDAAYCLLGLFGVNMPLLYGEGSTKAFVRLQKEILAQEPDYSLLVWHGPRTQWRVSVDPTPALAIRPQQFHRKMSLAILDLEENRLGGYQIKPSCIRCPEVCMLHWKDVVSARSAGPISITNLGLQGRLHLLTISSENDRIGKHNGDVNYSRTRTLAWTNTFYRDALVCVWLYPDRAFSNAVYSRDEAASLVLVRSYLMRAFDLTSIYLRLPSSNEPQDRDLRTIQRDVVLVDDSVAGSSLRVAAQYPDPIRYWDSPPIRMNNPVDLVEILVIGCYLVECGHSSERFILEVGKHTMTNQILFETAQVNDVPTFMTEQKALSITEEHFKGLENRLEISVDCFDDVACYSLDSDEGVVMIRVPVRPRRTSVQISRAYVRTRAKRISKEMESPSVSKFPVLFEDDQPRVAELDQTVHMPSVSKFKERVISDDSSGLRE